MRTRISNSIDLIIWGAGDSYVLGRTQMNRREMVYEAYMDAVNCLGANLRDEELPEPRKTWSDAVAEQKWVEENIRQAEGRE
ncbi:hypothetical protein [Streptomyces sp. TLI_105]|uniref:hypothetical protein n=1 Tax=Streptomyces sp. TLI_105 TaxID=1881019 RepID=UPI00089D39C1|nr:hypothetical protein [Streptomyces sp. TLI_105]SEE59680.1 hypothetical protein SAMN05428939_8056 [Streptomyces sp. TLI_105]